MSLEFWTAFASVGTLVVIAATAVAAMLQLRHMRAANQIAAVQTFLTSYDGPELRDAFHFVRTELKQRLEDPAFREELRTGDSDRLRHPEIQICNFFDQWGMYFRDGVIDRRGFMRVSAGVIARFWERLEPVIALTQDPVKGNTSFQQFEYLAIHSRRWLERHPEGDFPKGERRISLIDPWCDVDARSLAGKTAHL